MYCKMKRWQVFVNFSNKRRFEQIYKTSLQNKTVRGITKRRSRREVFLKSTERMHSEKLHKIHRKAPLLESLF